MLGEDNDTAESDNLNNELLQTIYFPKKAKNIGYLTDKLPKAKYEDLVQKEKKFGSSDTMSKDTLLP